MRVVIDTNVLARAYPGARGPARRVLINVLTGQHVLVLSTYLLLELERILRYPKLLQRSGLNSKDIAEYLEELAAVSCLVHPEAIPAMLLRDSKDAPILGTALAGSADVLCTRDADFFEVKVMEFCAQRGVRVLTDLELLEQLPV